MSVEAEISPEMDEAGNAKTASFAEPLPLLSRLDRAAVLLMLLDDEEASLLLGRLEPAELERIGAAMCAIGEIDRAAMAESMKDFVMKAA